MAGLPRSGATLLSALLNQRDDVHASPTSGILKVMSEASNAWETTPEIQASIKNPRVLRHQFDVMLKSMFFEFYKEHDNKIIIDRHREWASPGGLNFAKQIFKKPIKIIAPVRNIESIVVSYVKLFKPQDITYFINNHIYIKNIEECYKNLLHTNHYFPELLCFIDYDHLICDPRTELQKIEDFLGLENFEYDFDNIDGSMLLERDEEVYGVRDMHIVHKKLEQQKSPDPKEILGYHYYKYCQPTFWKKQAQQEVQLLDKTVYLGLHGKTDEASSILKNVLLNEPENHRAAFNYGWYLIRNNCLVDGHKHLFRGRYEHVFGNSMTKHPTPLWDGRPNITLLLEMEGGFGDQIHCAGLIKYIKQKNCKVIISCSKALMPILKDIDGVSAVVSHEHSYGVMHDFWFPAMSVVIPLGLEYKDIDGSGYLKRPQLIRGNKFRIGLRWQGNPQFEHEQHRLFPPNLLFDAVQECEDVEFVSLQRDEGSEKCPEWAKQVALSTWTETQYAIASCDLIISSCTSVAHMAAAMGVETWIVIPKMSYYVWAKPGTKTEWYRSVTLFRQETYGDWTAPFVNINHELKLKLGARNAYQNRLLDSGRQQQRPAVLGLQTATRKN